MRVVAYVVIASLFPTRYYLGKYKVRVLERISNKSYVEFLEKGIVGNKKVGYREASKGERIFLYTRNCYKNKRD